MLVPRVGTEPFTKVRNKIGKSGGDVIFCVGWQGCLCRGGMVRRDNTTKKGAPEKAPKVQFGDRLSNFY